MIKSLSIKNFKSIKEQDFNLANLTLLAGLNGMGKSSVLQLLLLLRQSFLQQFLNDTGLVLKSKNLIDLGTGKDVFNQNAASDEALSVRIKTSDNLTFFWDFKYQPDTDVLPLIKQSTYTESLKNNGLFNDQFQYLNAEHAIPRDSYETSEFEVVRKKNLGIKGEFVAHYLSAFGSDTIEFANLIHPKSNSTTLRHQVDAWLGDISPGTRVGVQDVKGLDLVRLTYQFETKDGYSNEFSPINVGFGITYALPVIVALLKSKPGDIVLIENPESHLHPKGQSSIGKLMALAAENGVQVLVETHSDHVINGVRVSVKENVVSEDTCRLFYFDRDINAETHNSTVKEISIDKNGELSLYPEGFLDEWNKQLMKLI